MRSANQESQNENSCHSGPQVFYIESSGKTRSPLGDRYLSTLIAQRLARLLGKRNVPGSNLTMDKKVVIL